MKPKNEEQASEQLVIEMAPDTEPATLEPAAQEPDKEERPLSQVLNERATEDESSLKGNFKLANILAGEMFNAAFLRKQVGLIIIIAIFVVISIGNRYSCQQRLIKIDQLQKSLQDMEFRSLSNVSRRTQECRLSNVLRKLEESHNSELKIPTQPPYQVHVPETN